MVKCVSYSDVFETFLLSIKFKYSAFLVIAFVCLNIRLFCHSIQFLFCVIHILRVELCHACVVHGSEND